MSKRPTKFYVEGEIVQASTKISKSQAKRDLEKVKQLSETLADLTPNQLSKLSIDDELIEAVKFAHKIGAKNEARRRQILFIAKLIRELDYDQIMAELEKLRSGHHKKGTPDCPP